MESFFRHIGMPTSIHELTGKDLTEEEIKELAYKCSFMNTRTIGQFKVLTIEDMENIYARQNNLLLKPKCFPLQGSIFSSSAGTTKTP